MALVLVVRRWALAVQAAAVARMTLTQVLVVPVAAQVQLVLVWVSGFRASTAIPQVVTAVAVLRLVLASVAAYQTLVRVRS